MNNPTKDDIISAIKGRSPARAAKVLRERGYEHVTAQWVRLQVSQMDQSELPQSYDHAAEILSSRNAKATSHKLRANIEALSKRIMTQEAFEDALSEVVSDLNDRAPVDFKPFIGAQAGIPMTVELLLSDLQIGKLGPGYNTPVARKRLFEYARAALFQIEQKIAAGYRVERIVLALLGDIIESDKKHKNSARATDTGTAEQIADALEGLFELVIEPLARLGVKLDIICVTGNHDHDDHGLNMFRPGREHLSYPLYRCLELLTRRSGYGNARFDIPDGSYTTATIYGQHILYEHGVGVSVTEQSMKAQKIKRAEQEKKHLTYFRMGDKHTVTSFNAGQLVVNGAFFGSLKGGLEYSGINGYSSIPAQWMGFHVERSDDRMSLYDTFTIQLGHITE